MWATGVERALTERNSRSTDAPRQLRALTDAMEYLERAVPRAGGLVLRYGAFYGPGTAIGEGGSTLEAVRGRRFPVVGGGAGVWSFVHIGDVARATMLAMEHGSAGIYIADDDPAPVSEWLPFLAEAVGVARAAGGGRDHVALMTGVRGIVNTKAKAELGWELHYPTWRQGFRKALG